MTVEATLGKNLRKGRAVFLDRDGVLNKVELINGRPHAPSSRDRLTIPSDVPQALKVLREAGYLLIVVTNQPDVARGITTKTEVEAINQELVSRLKVDALEVCFHDDADRCQCRKPAPGLLLSAAQRLRVDPRLSFMVGDRWRDIEAGRRAGCRTVLVGSGYGESFPCAPDVRVSSLYEGAQWILRAAKSEHEHETPR